MSTTHTPGPWSASDVRYNRDFRTCLNVMTKDGLCFVAAVSCDPSSDRQQLEANARLIAAAPDLLTAAEALGAMPEGYCFCSRDRIGDDSKVHEPECAEMRAAIAKARGL